MSRQPNPALVQLYVEMAAHTKSECDGRNGGCRSPHRCCERTYCEAAKLFAKEEYDIQLEYADPEAPVPFIGPAGCIVPPYLRPVCTIHACCISGAGCKSRGDDAQAWTDEYFRLRDAIDELEERALDDLVAEV